MWLKLTYSENERLCARETEDFERKQRQPEENLTSGEQTFSRGGGGVGVILQIIPHNQGRLAHKLNVKDQLTLSSTHSWSSHHWWKQINALSLFGLQAKLSTLSPSQL